MILITSIKIGKLDETNENIPFRGQPIEANTIEYFGFLQKFCISHK